MLKTIYSTALLIRDFIAGPAELRVLNDSKDGAESREKWDVLKLANQIQRTMLKLKGDHIKEDGRGIDYEALRQSEQFREYCLLVTNLNSLTDLHNLDEAQRKCFFINLYNALTIHGLALEQIIPKSVLNVTQFWQTTAYRIAGAVYSLDDIEHGILRANRPHPATGRKMFTDPNDTRLKLMLENFDPRIHFALVCGAKSCPAIQVYSLTNLEEGLVMASKSFIQQEVVFDLERNKVKISKIFDWYFSDFGKDIYELIKYAKPYMEGTQLEMAEKALASAGLRTEYFNYNWELNGYHS